MHRRGSPPNQIGVRSRICGPDRSRKCHPHFFSMHPRGTAVLFTLCVARSRSAVALFSQQPSPPRAWRSSRYPPKPPLTTAPLRHPSVPRPQSANTRSWPAHICPPRRRDTGSPAGEARSVPMGGRRSTPRSVRLASMPRWSLWCPRPTAGATGSRRPTEVCSLSGTPCSTGRSPAATSTLGWSTWQPLPRDAAIGWSPPTAASSPSATPATPDPSRVTR